MMTSLLLIASLGTYTSCTQVTESMEEAAIIAKNKAKALLAEDTGKQLINVYESLDIKEGIQGIAESFNVTITNQIMADLSEVVTLNDEVKTIDGKSLPRQVDSEINLERYVGQGFSAFSRKTVVFDYFP